MLVSSVPGDGRGSLQLTSPLVLVPAKQHTRLEGQSTFWSQRMGMSGTKLGGAGQVAAPRAQNRRVSPEALSSEQQTEPVTGQASVPQVTVGS